MKITSKITSKKDYLYMLKVEVVTKSSHSRFFTQAVFKFHLKKKTTPPRVPIPKSEFNLSLSYINVLKNGSANPTPHHPGRGWGVEVRTMTQISSFNCCKIFKNTFFHRTPLVAASDIQACKFIKRDSNTILFLRKLRNF